MFQSDVDDNIDKLAPREYRDGLWVIHINDIIKKPRICQCPQK